MSLSFHHPRIQKSAIIALDRANPQPRVIVFQYNPESLTRNLTPQTNEAAFSQGDALRYKGPPSETISLTAEADAMDQLAQFNPQGAALGVYPQLAALELLLYPQSRDVIANEALKAVGTIEVMPPKAPLTLLVWGAKRVLPVRITSMNITEEQFDAQLNPTVATVALEMDVLSNHDLGLTSPGGQLYLAQQMAKEVMANLHFNGNLQGAPATKASVPLKI